MTEYREFWSDNTETIYEELSTSAEGLTSDEVQKRLLKYGLNNIKSKKERGTFRLFLSQFKSPIILILLFATLLSVYVREIIDAAIIFIIVLFSGSLSFWQEHGANNAVQKLLALVQIKADVLRNSKETAVSIENIVPGDIAVLNAGDAVAGDCLIVESVSLFVDESALTGESYPVEKQAGVLNSNTELSSRTNCLWMGTHVISGTGKAVVVRTGKATEFGKIADRLRLRQPETEFERGIRKFGYLLMFVTIILVFSIFSVNIIFKRPVFDAFMFSLALAVGLTPQLLPAIISNNLSRGAKEMAKMKVIVKRLSSIENLGSMDILCSDKTGTLTDGAVVLKETLDPSGAHSDRVFQYAYINALFESGFINPIDAAVRECPAPDITAFSKLSEEPYDFIRKRLSILVSQIDIDNKENHIIITKGAFNKVLDVCQRAEMGDGSIVGIDSVKDEITNRYQEYSKNGYRTLGLAYKNIGKEVKFDRTQENDMIFLGFITLFDPPKQKVEDAVKNLKKLGVSLKIITGDNRFIAQRVMEQLGFSDSKILTGADLRDINDIALVHRVNETDVFAEVEPNQKERIVLALKKAGHVVGYMGDGINDVSALHDADVSISVDSAVDVAKATADIILMEKDLGVLSQGIIDGRKTFANTMKYVFMATSANFGNMFSMAGVSIFLPFLPLLPKQVLLTNLLTDLPEMAIATDNVDPGSFKKPHKWDIKFIQKFMLTFGLVSSIFDYLTFGALLFVAHASEIGFRTGWFTESVLSAAIIVLVIRSKRIFFRSKPGKHLLIATGAVVIITLLLPYTPVAGILGFAPLPPEVLLLIGIILLLYIMTAELVKMIFYKYVKF